MNISIILNIRFIIYFFIKTRIFTNYSFIYVIFRCIINSKFHITF